MEMKLIANHGLFNTFCLLLRMLIVEFPVFKAKGLKNKYKFATKKHVSLIKYYQRSNLF